MRAAVLAATIASLLATVAARADEIEITFAGNARYAFSVERLDGPALPVESALAPGRDALGRPLNEIDGVALRWWLRRGRADVGLGIGAIGRRIDSTDGRAEAPLLYGTSTLIVGWRWSMGERSLLYADASGMRSYGADLVQAKVGVEWKPRTSALGFERGALGIRFDSGYRMSLRAKRGGFGVYLRSQF
jgi:hypothetical protein